MSLFAAHTPQPWSAPGWQHGRLRTDMLSTATADQRLVLKIGGSLLARSDWPRFVTALVAAAPHPARTLVVGGGPVVDGLRRIDAAAPQPDELMHHLAIEALRVTARLAAAALGLPLSTSAADDDKTVVLDVPAWLARDPIGRALPAGWQVTSDSIAARVAAATGASLLLAKSAAPPPCPADTSDLESVAAAGWVDDHFPVAAAGLDLIEWAAPR
jgi:hypothetical protein